MAKIGVSKPYFALYNFSGGSVSYSGGGIFAKAVEFGTTIESTEDNNFYADNAVQEADKARFASGTLSVTTDEMTMDATAALLGMALKAVTVDTKPYYELVYDDDLSSPDLGFGVIVKRIHNGREKYRAIVLCKVKFGIPADAATTQGETIDWQTSELSGTIMRDDTAKHGWKREASFATEAEARKYIQTILNITLGMLTLTSVAGAESGKTAVSVKEELGSGHLYLYQTAAEVTVPELDDVITTGYTAWDGVSEITATTGQDLLVVEVDKDDYRVLKAGTVEVVALT